MSPRCQSCGRALAADGCTHPDCEWQPPFPYEPVDAERGLQWVRATRAQLHAIDKVDNRQLVVGVDAPERVTP